jgi:transposase
MAISSDYYRNSCPGHSALAQWYRARTEGPKGARKTTMIVALARKLLIAMWRLVTTGEIPDGVRMRSVAA